METKTQKDLNDNSCNDTNDDADVKVIKQEVISNKPLNQFALDLFKILNHDHKLSLLNLLYIDEHKKDRDGRLNISLGEMDKPIGGVFYEESKIKDTDNLYREEYNTFQFTGAYYGKKWYFNSDWDNEPKGKHMNKCFKAICTLLQKYFPMYEAKREKIGFANNNPVYKHSLIKTMHKFHNQRQVIYYGAPGTGKSYAINEIANKYKYDNVRTTFHPDSDYPSFVGSYKPVMNGEKITYKFVRQAFTKAYLAAWKKYAVDGDKADPQFLIIEEINRGNCAQIFGDIFQLLDRNDEGFSSYPVEADTDLCKEINYAFNKEIIDKVLGEYRLPKGCQLDIEGKIEGYKGDLSKDVKEGKVLLLPPNLYIWATMNTSDQSLFPIDSAFKRRWDWKYTPIMQPKATGEKEKEARRWKIKANKRYCYWWEFLVAINKEIEEITNSEDKQLGYFFAKPKAGNDYIDAETFVSKVIFYLWNDVFKDEDSDIFKYKKLDGKWDVTVKGFDDTNKDIYFRNFFTSEGIDDELVCWFINHLLKKHESPMLDGINQNPITKESQDSLPPIAYMRNENEIEGQSDGDKKPEKPHAAENDLEQPATES